MFKRGTSQQAGFICFDLEAFIADCLSRVGQECERAGIRLKAYPMLSRIAEDRVDFAYHASRVAGRFFTVTKPKATPEGQTLSVNWSAAWACAWESDVVVLLGIQGGTALVATALAVLLRRRLVAISQTLPPEAERQRVWWIRWLKGWILNRCHVHVAQTPATRDTLRLVYRIPETLMVDAPFEAGAAIFRNLIGAVRKDRHELRRNFGWGGEAVFLFVGTLLRFKGVEALLIATAELVRTAASFRVVLIGAAAKAPSEPSIGDYEALAAEKGVDGVVTFTGGFSAEQLAGAYVAADALVLPTEKDTWGKVLVEAALAGLPLITTSACGAAGSLVRDGQTGFVVAPADPLALAGAMRKLLDPGLRRVLGNNAQSFCEEFCDPVAEAVGFREAIVCALERN